MPISFRTMVCAALGLSLALAWGLPARGAPEPELGAAELRVRAQLGPTAAQPPEPLPTPAPRPGAVPRRAAAPRGLPPTVAPARDAQHAALGLADLKCLALANHPTLRAAAARVEAARGAWVQTGLYPNPSAGYIASDVGEGGSAGKQGGFVTQEFVRGGKLSLNRAAAAGEVFFREQQLAAQRFRVETDVEMQFYEVLAARQRLDLIREIATTAGANVAAAERLLELKEGSRLDLLRARTERDQTTIAVVGVRQIEMAAWRRLAATVGVPNLTPAPLDGQLEKVGAPYSFDEARERLLSGSPELAAARAQILRLRRAVDRAEVEPVPNVLATVMVQRDTFFDEDLVGVQVGMPLPIYNKNQGAQRQMRAELAAGQAELGRIELKLQSLLADVYRRYVTAWQQVDTYRQRILPDAKATAALAQRRYREGEDDLKTSLYARRTYLEIQLGYLTALGELRQSEAELNGLLLSGSLADRP